MKPANAGFTCVEVFNLTKVDRWTAQFMSTKSNVGGRLETKTAFIKDLIGDIQKAK